MPRGDSTGPEGKGSKTGRGLGKCSGNNISSNLPKRGQGLGRGLGRNRNAKA